MIVSLNEIEAAAAKAVRGCGLPVGLADEMGFAARWLGERELPGVAALLSALDDFAPTGVAALAAGTGLRVVTAAGDGDGHPIPALLVAPSLIELAMAGDSSPNEVEVEVLTHPLLLLPFVARNGSTSVAARWSTEDGPVMIEPSGDGVHVRAQSRAALIATIGHHMIVGAARSDDRPPVLLASAEMAAASQRSITGGCSVPAADWRRLGQQAQRTYVPVSDHSRLRGAGAGLTDND